MMLIEVTLTIILIATLKKYIDRRNALIRNSEDSDGAVRAKNHEKKNAAIALILCSLSALVHCVTFSVKLLNYLFFRVASNNLSKNIF